MDNKGNDNFYSYSFSIDCLVFGFQNGKIHVLLVKRGREPFKNQWAIPGTLVFPDEDLPEAGKRIYSEVVNASLVDIYQGLTFGSPKRHPSGRVITTSYFMLVKMDKAKLTTPDWALESNWFPVLDVCDLAFDHDEILRTTYEILKQKLSNEPVCFDLLSEKFVLNDMQKLYEYAFEKEYDKANFRKKIKPLPLIDLKERQSNVNHRPAKLYQFDKKAFEKRMSTGDYSFKM